MRTAIIIPLVLGLFAAVPAAGGGGSHVHKPAPVDLSDAPPPAAGAAVAADDGRLAPLLEGMGDLHFPISTDVPLAQRYFDQGLVLAYGFNHAEAERSFREAARRDPDCAICWWGAALVLGPNINAPMKPNDAARAWSALRTARELAARDGNGGAGERERALIEALAARYAETPPEDRSGLDRAYADAMREVARRFPGDIDAAVLFAEALMDTMPWDYWQEDGAPKPATEEVLATLDAALARDPDHPGANHLKIHAVERFYPERGLEAARNLERAVPGAGHLVHMPSHIYLNLGMYHEATAANQRAVASDRDYLVQCHAQGLYPVAYASHNLHFLWAAATQEGRSALAIETAERIAARLEGEHAGELRGETAGSAQHFWITPLYARVRFGRWDEVVATPEPPADFLYPRGVWHYARGLAQVRKGRLEEAATHLDQLSAVIAEPALEGVTFWDMNLLTDLLGVARRVLAGELAAARGDFTTAIRELEAGVAAEDALNYDDPPDWHHPVRQVLGAALLAAGRPAEAERVYREDLERQPHNGWSLYGLRQSLAARGESAEAAAAAERFAEAWRHADVELTSSRL